MAIKISTNIKNHKKGENSNVETLRQILDQIIIYSDYQTPPKSTPCWEWLSELFKKTVSHEKIMQNVSIKIYDSLYYEVTVDADDEAVEEGPVPFSFDEIRECYGIANYNFIDVPEPGYLEDDCFMQFVYHLI